MVIQNKNIYSHTEYSLNVMKCELTTDNKKTCKNKIEPAKCKIFVFFFITINKPILFTASP